jgi:hypothetical protein
MHFLAKMLCYAKEECHLAYYVSCSVLARIILHREGFVGGQSVCKFEEFKPSGAVETLKLVFAECNSGVRDFIIHVFAFETFSAHLTHGTSV